MTAGVPIVTGPRLRLRPFVAADIGDVYLGWLNDSDHLRFSTQRGRRHDAESCRAYLASFGGTPHYFWAIEERESGTLVGTMTAYADAAATDVGILVGHPGRGIGREAWGLALDQLLRAEGRPKVTAGTAAAHTAMRRIFERWGMTLEETRPDGGPGGLPMEIVRYGVTRDAWMVKSRDADR